MDNFLLFLFLIYFAVINLIAVSLTLYDKYAAKNGKWRIKESTLLILAALSGCVCEYITMRLIRHKTRKLKFMLLIPVIFILECAVVIFFICKFNGFGL